jgi:hypothetical protein
MIGETANTLFTIRLTGENVRPDQIGAGDLAQLLIAAEQTVLSVAREENPDESEDIIVTLADVKSESVGLEFSSNRPELVRHAFYTVVDRVRANDFHALPGPVLEGLRTLTRFTSERKGHTQFWNGTANGPLLDLPPNFEIGIPRPQYQRGETVLYGNVERVGGVKPRIKLRVAPNRVIYGDVSPEQGRALGAALYKPAALRGKATWDIRTGQIEYFRVTEILTYAPTDIRDAFAELREATNGAYETVDDIDLFASQVREGELP